MTTVAEGTGARGPASAQVDDVWLGLKLQQWPAGLRVIQGRWKLLILRELIEAVRRFSDLQRSLSGVSQKVLTAQLRELEGDGVVERTVYPEVPPRVEYALTSLGRELIPVLEGLHAWGARQGVPTMRTPHRQPSTCVGRPAALRLRAGRACHSGPEFTAKPCHHRRF